MSFDVREAYAANSGFQTEMPPIFTPATKKAGMSMFGLLEMAHNHTELGRKQLAATVSDLLTASDNQAHISLIGDILIELVRKAEQDLKQALAERLAHIPHAPRELMVFLANDEIPVASPVLALSQALQDEDLIAVIRERSTYHRQIIAERPDLNPTVVQSLVVTHDVTALQKLLHNAEVKLDRTTLQMLAKASKDAEILQPPLLGRPEISSDFALDLYWWVSQELRRHISTRFAFDRRVLDEALESTLQEMLDQRNLARNCSPDMLQLAQAMQTAGKITIQKITTILRRGQIGAFIALYSAHTGLVPEAVETMVYQHNGESLAITARAVGMIKPDFAAMFLLARAARPGDQVVDPRELSRVLTFFDHVMMGEAMNLLQVWQKSPDDLYADDFNTPNALAKSAKMMH